MLDCDLRINDNPALFNGIKNHQEAMILFILDEKNKREIGSASKWFLHHSLLKIQKEYILQDKKYTYPKAHLIN
jgi:deoxyribodipyrimidine photolyase